MAEHIAQWLEAYHDGELRGARLYQVERHLAECAACRAELEITRKLSATLRHTAPVGDFLTAERFASNLILNLPRQPESAQSRIWLDVGWWLIPVGLLGAWLFIQVTFLLSDAIQLAVNSGFFNGNLAWLQGSPIQMEMEWFAATTDLLGNRIGSPGQEILSAINAVDLFFTQAVRRYVWQILLAILYLGWFASWWLRSQSRSPQDAGSFSQTA